MRSIEGHSDEQIVRHFAVRRFVLSCYLLVSVVGCSGATSIASPAGPSTALPTAVRVGAPSPTAPAALPSSSSPIPWASLVPRTARALDRGTWTRVKGAALVAPNAVAVRAGGYGALLVSSIRSEDDPCEPPERTGHGAPLAFYDARAHAITRVAGEVPQVGLAVASLADGRVMVVGGADAEGGARPSRRTQLWDPRTRTWADGAPMAIGRESPFLVTMTDGRLMVAGGNVPVVEAGDVGYLPTHAAELYDPATDRWTAIPPANLSDEGGPAEMRALVALAGGRVLGIADGSAAQFDPVSETWTPLAWDVAWPTIALRDGTVLVLRDGSQPDADRLVPEAARIDPVSGLTRVVGYPSAMFAPATAVLADGQVFLAGGEASDEDGSISGFLSTAEILDPDRALLSEIAAMPAPRTGSAAVALHDGSVLVVGGADTSYTHGDDPTPGCVPVKFRVVRWAP